MSVEAAALKDALGIPEDVAEAMASNLNDPEKYDKACAAVGAINPNGFFGNLVVNDFRAMKRGKGFWATAGAVGSTVLKAGGVALGVLGCRAGYKRWVA